MSDLVQEMRMAAATAARAAAGKVIGDRITEVHSGLPHVNWYADDLSGRWEATGHINTDYSDAQTRHAVAAYAEALGGSEPREVERDEVGCELETTAHFEGIPVTVWGVLMGL